MQKQSYQSAKKRITSELATVLKDSSVVIVSDWLKVRGTLRDWTKLWAVLKPGLMLLYRNPPSKVRFIFLLEIKSIAHLVFLFSNRTVFGLEQ